MTSIVQRLKALRKAADGLKSPCHRFIYRGSGVAWQASSEAIGTALRAAGVTATIERDHISDMISLQSLLDRWPSG